MTTKKWKKPLKQSRSRRDKFNLASHILVSRGLHFCTYKRVSYYSLVRVVYS